MGKNEKKYLKNINWKREFLEVSVNG